MALNRSWIAAGLIGALVGGGAVALGTGRVADPERARIQAAVRDYILAHPEIIPQALERLQQRESGAAIDARRAAYETPFGSAWAGAADGDVVLVQFFDYACGYCRQSNADLERLLREDKRLKIVWRELPVLGPDSQAAAEVSLAAAEQGKFRTFYDRLFEAGRPTPEAVAAAKRAAGVTAMSSPSFQAEIDRNYELARAVNATGTPTFVIGDQVLQGAVGYQKLKQAIAEARAS